VISGSLVISTYQRPSALGLVLASTLAQTERPSEVVIADDGSGEETRAVVHSFAPRFAAWEIPLLHVWQPDEGFRLAAARNRAIAASTGEYLMLVDGDCVLHRDFVRSHRAFARRGSFVQGTRVLLDQRATARMIETGATSLPLSARGVRNRLNAISAPLLSRLVPSGNDPLRGVRGANMAFWRSDLLRVNGFNERFTGWGREDSELVVRLTNAGVRRRKLKFGGIVYHLWHSEQPRESVARNDALLDDVRRSAVSWCVDGLDRYLAQRHD
jgi:glycosyltransferase involved in cell wall biosynthesis